MKIPVGMMSPPPVASIRAEAVSWATRFAELVDNAFDARATRIEIRLHNAKKFTVKDDGHGVEDLEAMTIYGKSVSGPHQRLGRYGVGAKQVLFMGSMFSVATVRGGYQSTLHVNVDANMRTPSLWNDAEADLEPDCVSPSGTVITVDGIYKGPIRVKEVADRLSYLFWPAIMGGSQILIGTKDSPFVPVPAWQPPPLDRTIDGQHDFGDGRSFRFRAGIIHDLKFRSNPDLVTTSIAYHYRVLTRCNVGRRADESAPIYVGIRLSETAKGKWSIDKNKGEIDESQRDEIDAIIAPLLKPLFDEEKQSRHHLQIDGLTNELNAVLGVVAGTTTPRPGRGDPSGNQFGRGGGRQPAPLKGVRSPVGRANKSRRRGASGIRIVPRPLGPDGPPYVYTAGEKETTITYNTDHVLWTTKLERDDLAAGMLAFDIYVQGLPDAEDPGSKQLILAAFDKVIIGDKAALFGNLVTRWLEHRAGIRSTTIISTRKRSDRR